jgi:hypothetical protein
LTSKKQPEDNQEIDWAKLILRRFKKAEAVLQQARDYNQSNGISKELERQYISWTKPQVQKKYENFLNSVINPDTGEWNNIKFLRTSKQISKTIESDYDGREYPRVELYQIIRIKTKANEDRIYRCLNLIGLNIKGEEVALYVDDCDLERIPRITYPTLPVQTVQAGSDFEQDGFGRTSVAKITNHEPAFHGTEIAPTKYLVPFSEQTIREWLEEGKNRLRDDPYNGCHFAVHDESQHYLRNSYSVKTLEEFLTPSIDELYTKLSTPPRTFNEDDLRRLGKIFKDDKADNDDKIKDQHIQ